MNREIQVVIAGAGIGGLSLAGFLRRAGLEPVVVERADGLDERGGALELWPEAMALLSRLGVADDVREAGTHVTEWSLRRPDGSVAERLDADEGGGLLAVPYGHLRDRLVGALPDGSVRTGTALRSFETSGGAVIVTFDNGVREQFDLVVGADGTTSRTRELLGGGAATPCGTASVAFPFPPETDLPGAREVWTAGGTVLRALPAGDRPMGWLTVPADAPGVADADPTRLADVLSGIEWSLVSALRDVQPGAVWRGLDRRVPAGVRAEGRVALVGDAAQARHRLASVGPTTAIEDAAVLASELLRGEGTLPERLADYAARRRSRLDRLFDVAGGDVPLAGAHFPEEYSRIRAIRGARLEAGFGSGRSRPAIDAPPSPE